MLWHTSLAINSCNFSDIAMWKLRGFIKSKTLHSPLVLILLYLFIRLHDNIVWAEQEKTVALSRRVNIKYEVLLFCQMWTVVLLSFMNVFLEWNTIIYIFPLYVFLSTVFRTSCTRNPSAVCLERCVHIAERESPAHTRSPPYMC